MGLQKTIELIRAQGLAKFAAGYEQDSYAFEEVYQAAADGGTTPAWLSSDLNFFAKENVQVNKIQPAHVLGFKLFTLVRMNAMSGSPLINQPGMEAEAIETYIRACKCLLRINGTNVWEGRADALHTVEDEEYVCFPAPLQLKKGSTVNIILTLENTARTPLFVSNGCSAPSISSFEGKYDLTIGARLYLNRGITTCKQ